MGKESTRKAPGTIAIATAFIASSVAAKTLSLSDSTFKPYAIDNAKEPERLSDKKATSEPNLRIERTPTYKCTCFKKRSGDPESRWRKTFTAL